MFPHLFTNSLEEIKITMKGETAEAFADTGATLPVLNHA